MSETISASRRCSSVKCVAGIYRSGPDLTGISSTGDLDHENPYKGLLVLKSIVREEQDCFSTAFLFFLNLH